jgi:hypothetical protein
MWSNVNKDNDIPTQQKNSTAKSNRPPKQHKTTGFEKKKLFSPDISNTKIQIPIRKKLNQIYVIWYFLEQKQDAK